MSRFRVSTPLVVLAALAAVAPQAAGEPPKRPAKYEVPFSAPQNFIDHARFFEEETIRVGPHKIWNFNTPNRGFGNVIVIEGEEELVVLDTTVAVEHAQVAAERLREMTDKPVVAVVYSHHHADHINGTTAFVSREDAASGKVKVIAAENFLREAGLENAVTGPIMALRAGYMYGVLLPGDAEGKHFHIGCCGFDLKGTNGYIEPNTFVPMEDELAMTLAGFRFVFFRTGGEAASHIAAYMPDQKIIFTGDEIQGPTFPQLHSLRGTRPRDIERWVRAMDKMRGYESEYLVPSHGQIVEGKAEVEKVFTYYRDAMQYVHDQSVRLINRGFTPDEIAETIRLPDSVVIEPWTTEYYGNVDVSARNVYGGYISWWNGDPAELRPTPRLEKARRMVEMMGGRDEVFAAAEKAFFDGDAQWAAELTTPLIRLDKEDWPARHLKAAALRVLGYEQTSSSLRGFYLTGARELDGLVDPRALQRTLSEQIFSVEDAPTSMILDNLRFSIDPERADGKRISLGYDFTDTGEAFTLVLRNSVLEIIPSLPEGADAVLRLTRAFGNQILLGQTTFESGIESGAIVVKGRKAAVTEFHAVFDRPEELPDPHLALR
ncbi:MAG: alkyl sulfatase dimerization domain-containing protein [Myxococcota bacterium]|nr:alkyl sulfatase dimerization domain-containing protein [Myxococcota bacterium]